VVTFGLGLIGSQNAPRLPVGHAPAVSDVEDNFVNPAASLTVGVSLNPCGSPVDVTGGYVPSGVEVCVLVHVESGGSNFPDATVALSDTQGSTFEPLSPSQGWVTNGAGQDWATFYSPVVASATDTITASATASGYSGSGQATLTTGAEGATLALNVTGASNTQAGGSEVVVAELSWNPGAGYWVPVRGAQFTATGSDGSALYNGPASLNGNEVLIEFNAPSGLSVGETYTVTVVAQMLGYTVGQGQESFQVSSLGNPSNPYSYLPSIVIFSPIVIVIVYYVVRRLKKRSSRTDGSQSGLNPSNLPAQPGSAATSNLAPSPNPSAPTPHGALGPPPPVSPNSQVPSSPENFCPNCGQPTPGDFPFCRSCGMPLSRQG
jgi:hypothetical protein